MKNCLYCNRKNSKEKRHLSNGECIHVVCYEELEGKMKDYEEAIQRCQHNINHYSGEISKTEGVWGFFFSSDSHRLHLIKLQEEEGLKMKEILVQQKKYEKLLEHIYDYWGIYPPDWQNRKDLLRNESDCFCRNCKVKQFLDVHHINSLETGGSNRLDNLEFLCRECHQRIHGCKFGENFTKREEGEFTKKLNKIDSAILKKQELRFSYRKGDGTMSNRNILPSKITEIPFETGIGFSICVEGYCYLRKEDRVFAIRRMFNVSVVDHKKSPSRKSGK